MFLKISIKTKKKFFFFLQKKNSVFSNVHSYQKLWKEKKEMYKIFILFCLVNYGNTKSHTQQPHKVKKKKNK